MAEENMENPTTNSSSKGSMNPMMIGGVVLVLILIGAGLFFFMGKSNKNIDDMAPAVTNQNNDSSESTVSSGTTTSNSDVVSVNMEAGNFYFKPNVIKAKLGQTVRVTVTGVGMQHDFIIDELGVKSSTIAPGKSDVVEFVASEVGQFQFYCSVGNHKQMGMVGTLNVTE